MKVSRFLAAIIVALSAGALFVSCTEDTARYERASEATVLVESEHGKGTGFIIKRHERLFVFTAAHVVTECNELTIHKDVVSNHIKYGEFTFKAEVIARDETLDLAVLWLKAPTKYFGCVEFDSGNSFPAGTPVYHIGNFFGDRFRDSLSTGIVSHVGVSTPEPGFPWPIVDQMTTLVVPGSSGGPVFDYSDRIIGVVVGTAFPGVEFFVPVRAVRQFAKANKLQWLMHGFWSPTDGELEVLASKAKVEPVVPISFLDLFPAPKTETKPKKNYGSPHK